MDILIFLTLAVSVGTGIVAFIQMNIMTVQRGIMDKQTDLMNRQIDLAAKQDAIISAQLAKSVSLELRLNAPTLTKPTLDSAIQCTVVIVNNGTKTADGFYWHLWFDARLRPQQFTPPVANPESVLFEGAEGVLYRSFAKARIYPHSNFELCKVNLRPAEDGEFRAGWRLASEDFVSPELRDHNPLILPIRTVPEADATPT